MPGKLITIATFSQPTEANFAKIKLESEGIKSFIADEFIVTMNWLYSNAVGGVKLQVSESDVEQAVEILRQEQTTVDSVEDKSSADDEIRCPICNSSDVDFEKFSRRLVFASWLLLGIPFPFFKRKWRCRQCGYRWKDEEPSIKEEEIEEPEYTVQTWGCRKNVIMNALISADLAKRGWALNELEVFSNEVEEAKDILEEYNLTLVNF